MFRLRWTSEYQPRWKNGQPPHSTTGVASSSSIHEPKRLSIGEAMAGMRCPIVKTSSGTVSATLTQKRRVMSASSGFSGSSAEVTVRGSSAMPQIGQLPGASRTISGCIGQVHSVPFGAACAGAGACAVCAGSGAA